MTQHTPLTREHVRVAIVGTGFSGLGMAIVRSAIERHGGQVRLETAPGKGTTIELEIPASPPAPTSPP